MLKNRKEKRRVLNFMATKNNRSNFVPLPGFCISTTCCVVEDPRTNERMTVKGNPVHAYSHPSQLNMPEKLIHKIRRKTIKLI